MNEEARTRIRERINTTTAYCKQTDTARLGRNKTKDVKSITTIDFSKVVLCYPSPMRNHSFLEMFIWVTTRNSRETSHKHIRLFMPNTKQTTTTTKPHKSPDTVGAIFLNEAWYKLSVNSRTEASTNSQPNQQNTTLDVSQFISLINEFLNVSFPPYTTNIFLLFSYAVLIGLSSALWGNSVCERHVS